MGIEFARPWLWLLVPLCAAVILLIEKKYGKRRRGLKQKIAKVTRFVLVFLLIAALTGPALLLPGNRAATWALADLSASSQAQTGAMRKALEAGFPYAAKDLMIGVIGFGNNAMVDAPLATGRATVALNATPDASGTDIGRALSLALALLPEDAAGRIALLSDGKDNGNGVTAQLSALQARGIAVDVLPFESGFANDVQITSVTPPAQVYQGEKFDVTVQIDATYDTTGTLVLYANREPVATRDITVRKGKNTFVFQDVASSSGVVTYEAQLVAEGDDNLRNNRLGAYMDVRGVPRVLVASPSQSELPALLTTAGMQVDTLLPTQLPDTVEGLREYHAIALVNVNIDDLSEATLAALDDYVRKLGRGLCVFGGDDSYALGGWRGSALEDMLPVTMDVDNRLEMPSLSLVLVIDKSGSMTEGRFGITRLEMAKEAAMRSTEVLTARDFVGVIAFDDAAKWVVPIQQVEDVLAIQELIGTIRPGGGTAFYSPLSQALVAQVETEAQLKHVIFLTDGEAADGGFDGIVSQMAEHDITLTTVAVGNGANTTLLSRLAEMGKGRAYSTSEFDDIPKIFTKETYLATRAYIQNRTFYPVIWSAGPLTDYAGFPPVDGYLASTAKPLATVALATDRDEPLLAWWQYGAGRTLAWTSDVEGAWTKDLLSWEEASKFFAGMLSHVFAAEKGEGELTVRRHGDTISLKYVIEGTEDGLTTEAIVLQPDGTQVRTFLSATAPGVYEGTLESGQEGAYAIMVEQKKGDDLVRTLESGLTVGYSDEYDLRAADGSALLAQIAQATGGRLLTDAAQLFTEQGVQTRARRDITSMLVLAALILFVLDVSQRRLAWERWLPQKKTAPEKAIPQKTAKAPKESPAKKDNKKEPPAPPPPPVTDTADKLLANRKKQL